MADLIIRTRDENRETETLPKPPEQDIAVDKKAFEDEIEPPFSDYQLVKHKPYSADVTGQFLSPNRQYW